jgi:hypothetical protein
MQPASCSFGPMWPHRCTVVGNPGGGGTWFFWQILLRGVLGVVRKSVGGKSFLLHFYVEVFKNLYRGYMRCLPSPPVCIYVWPPEPFEFVIPALDDGHDDDALPRRWLLVKILFTLAISLTYLSRSRCLSIM